MVKAADYKVSQFLGRLVGKASPDGAYLHVLFPFSNIARQISHHYIQKGEVEEFLTYFFINGAQVSLWKHKCWREG